MTTDRQEAWHPDRSWADPLIALLALLALLAAGFTLRARQQGARRPAERASLQGRMVEVALAGPRLLMGGMGPAPEWTKREQELVEPWDRALLAVLKAEVEGPTETPVAWIDQVTPPAPMGRPYRTACLAAYTGAPLPTRAEREEVHRRLGRGYAADLLEARLRDREGGGDPLRAQARQALQTRLAGLGFLGLIVLALAVGGAGVGIYLLATHRLPLPRVLPEWSLSGRAVTLVMLGWFLAFFVAGNLSGLLLLPWPHLRWLAVPLGYLLHVTFGFWLLCQAEGMAPSDLWRRVAPGRLRLDLAWGLAFLALAVFLVITVALASSLVLKPDQSPQRDLQELLRGLSGWGPNLTLFLTVAVVAPFWEELLFRGFLLPVLARNGRIFLALCLSALLFGAIHLQPVGLPTLSTLGFVMALAMRHTGSLRAPILVHACWNGSLFLLMRAFA